MSDDGASLHAAAPAQKARLADFTATRRIIPISSIAVVIGVVGALAANALLQLIALATNVFFFQRFSTHAVSPAQHQLGPLVVVVPVVGALLIGALARWGSERIRGHGIPEALEAILVKGSKVEPRVAILKPISSAISIGSGGPFGAEGPIVMTGGAVGSLIAQVFHLTAAERKTLLVAGAAAGMSATFSAPLAATLLAVELLLFELKPRSLVPVALASATAAVMRVHLLGPGPLFPVHHPVPLQLDARAALACVAVGLAVGAVASAMTWSVYAAEDAFKRVPLHWMWWPAIGAVAVGVGGLVCPRALGVGYDVIGSLLAGSMDTHDLVVLVVVKWAIWAIALGSGTSGGVLAPLLMIGSAAGGLLAPLLPAEAPGFWSLVAMGAVLAGAMRSPLMGTVFALELTHDVDALVPVLLASAAAHAFTVLVLKRSILTEKVARRGYHVTREYQIDPLEVLFVRDVMTPSPGEVSLTEARAHLDEPLRAVLVRMAEAGRTELGVVDASGVRVGEVTLAHVLKAQQRHLEEETRRERVIEVHAWMPEPLRPSVEKLTSLSITEMSRRD